MLVAYDEATLKNLGFFCFLCDSNLTKNQFNVTNDQLFDTVVHPSFIRQ